MKIRRRRYRTLYIDPPWPEVGGGRIVRGCQRHYPPMKVSAIIALNLGAYGLPDSHCYLWVTNNYLEDGLELMNSMMYRYITTITWTKDRIGLGQYYRGLTEHCLFGVRGRIPYRYLPNGKRAQGVTGFFEKKGEHSAKPKTMRQMIERVSPGPYIEMFARERTPGWTVWGDEVR